MNSLSDSQPFDHLPSSVEAIKEETTEFRLHQTDDISDNFGFFSNRGDNPLEASEDIEGDLHPVEATEDLGLDDLEADLLQDLNHFSEDAKPQSTPDIPRHFTTVKMIYGEDGGEGRLRSQAIERVLPAEDEASAREAYKEVLEIHEQVLRALDSLTDPSILSEKFVWDNQGNTERPVIHRTLEIEILNAISRGDAHTAYELTSEIQKNFLMTDDSAQSERNLRYLSVQALAFFTQVLLNLGISVDLAFFLLDFFNKQINSLRSVNSLLAYQNHMLQVYLNQVQKHRERNFSPPIQRAVNYVRQNTKYRLSLGHIAKYADVHPNYLSQKFSQEVGVTLSQFIGNERMSSIKSYLVETDIPLSEIAKRFSFSSNSYFSTYFRKHTGMSPSRYRKEHRKY